MRTVKFATIVIAASATLFACKPKDEAPTPATGEVTEEAAQEDAAPSAAAFRREACNLTMSAPEMIIQIQNTDVETAASPAAPIFCPTQYASAV